MQYSINYIIDATKIKTLHKKLIYAAFFIKKYFFIQL